MAGRPHPRVSLERRHVAAAARAGATGLAVHRAGSARVRPGGGSQAAAETATVDDYARDLGVLLDKLAVDCATIGGLSMGGYVTFAMLRQSPERFTGLILADTKSQADTPEGREGRRKMIELVRASGASAVADQMLPKLLSAATRRTRPEVEAQVRQMIESTSVPAIVAALEALSNRPDSTPDLAGIRYPPLIVVGAEDVLTPVADAEAMDQPDCAFDAGDAARCGASLQSRIAGRVLKSAR